MKKLLSAVTICCLGVGLSASPALAQQTATNNDNNPNTTTVQNRMNTNTATAQNTMKTNSNTKFDGKLLRGSNVIGADLYNGNGEDIGQINDVVFDENTGGTSYAILAAGGWLGIGDKLTPVKWDSVQLRNKGENNDNEISFVTNLTKQQLTQEKSFDKSSWSDSTANSWVQQLPNTQNKKLVRMSSVDDAKLLDQNGNQIGGIKEAVMDAKSGKVAYAVVSFDDSFINKGDKLTMVPWKLVRQSQKDTPGYVLHADKSKLENATYFSPGEWPNVHDVTWNKDVYDYYAVTPYYWTGGI
jgi:sporulation protein YlmC with PRC-barrel domain